MAMAAMRAAQKAAPLFRYRATQTGAAAAAAGLGASCNSGVFRGPNVCHSQGQEPLTMLPKHTVRATARLVSCVSMGSLPQAQAYFVNYLSPY